VTIRWALRVFGAALFASRQTGSKRGPNCPELARTHVPSNHRVCRHFTPAERENLCWGPGGRRFKSCLPAALQDSNLRPVAGAAFDDYRGAVEALIIRRSELERQIAEQLPASPWAQTAKGLMCLRGIDTLTAARLCAEIGDFPSRQSIRDTPMGTQPRLATPDARRRALRRNPGPAVPNPRISV
jgi:hypothetical protein